MEWYDRLPRDLCERAYKTAELDDCPSEWAWNRPDALRVIEILSNNGYVVDGVEIWLATSPGPTIPTPFVYDWHLGRANRPSSRYPKTAVEFVGTFQWDPTDTSHEPWRQGAILQYP